MTHPRVGEIIAQILFNLATNQLRYLLLDLIESEILDKNAKA